MEGEVQFGSYRCNSCKFTLVGVAQEDRESEVRYLDCVDICDDCWEKYHSKRAIFRAPRRDKRRDGE